MQDILDQQLAESMETSASLREEVSSSLIAAATLASQHLSSGGKLCYASCDKLFPVAQLSVANMMQRKQQLRPALPACLASPVYLEEDLQASSNLDKSFHELKALCNPGDCSIFLIEHCTPETALAISRFSAENKLSVVSVLHCDWPNMCRQMQVSAEASTTLANERHCVVPVNVSSIARKQEITLFILNCLNAMIEQSLFGTVIENS